MPLLGDKITLEYYEPKNGPADQSPVQLRVRKVAHGFRGLSKNFQDSGSCNRNVACADQAKWKDQINSVVMILTDDSQRFCSGTMINNS